MKHLIAVLVGLVVCWLVGDFVYALIVNSRLRRWEASLQWDADGVRAGCREYTVGNGQTALLLIHGINDSPRIYEKMARLLAEQGFTCRVMRLPGFAMRMKDYATTSHGQWIKAVEREVAALRRRHEHVSIVAHSLGGAVTIAYLRQHPDSVDQVVLIAPAVAVSNHRSPLLSTRAWHEIGRRLLLFSRVTETPFANDAHAEDQRDYPWRTPFCPRKVFDETFALLDSNQGQAPALRQPLLMVLSRDDRVTDWKAAEAFYQAAGSSNKQMRFMKDAGHAIPIDNGWKELTLEIASFLRPE